MAEWKKYDIYENNEYKGTINVNYKKILAVVVSAFIMVNTMTGCSIRRGKITNEPQVSTELIYETKDDEIQIKFKFIDLFLDKYEDTMAIQLKDLIMQSYIKAKEIESNLSIEHNEYVIFYTEDKIESMKNEIIRNLDESIKIIESHSSCKFGEDFTEFKVKAR